MPFATGEDRRTIAQRRPRYLKELLPVPFPGAPRPKPTRAQIDLADDLVRLDMLLAEATELRLRLSIIGQRERTLRLLRSTFAKRRR